jgi:hypothetical protein
VFALDEEGHYQVVIELSRDADAKVHKACDVGWFVAAGPGLALSLHILNKELFIEKEQHY